MVHYNGENLYMIPSFMYFSIPSVCHLNFLQIPESNESFTVALTSVTGDARIAMALSEAIFTVRHNDDPVVFGNSIVEVREGEDVVLNIVRGGAAEGTYICMCVCARMYVCTNVCVYSSIGSILLQ